MKKFISKDMNKNEELFNYKLINREYDNELIYYLIDSCRSLEVLPNIKFIGFEHITDEDQIKNTDYIKSRKKKLMVPNLKNDKKKVEYRYIPIKETRQSLLIVKFQIECGDEIKIINKEILVPLKDEEGFFTIKGSKYFLMYQTVESSTYNTKNNLTLKSLMPLSIKRVKKEYSDIDGNVYFAPTYRIFIFTKEVDIFLIYFSKKGVNKTLKYFNVDNVIEIIEVNNKKQKLDKEKYIYFNISNKIYIQVLREFFKKYQYVQSMVFMILNVTTNRLLIDNLEDKSFWIEKLGSTISTNQNSYVKGKTTLTFFNRLLDYSTKNILKLHEENKSSVFAVVRWMIQNFSELRKKDNLSLDNKRLRCNEYIASLLTKEFSDRISGPINLGNNLTMKKLEDIFKFPSDILFIKMHNSVLLHYDDTVNDMNFFLKLKITQKGPQSLGNKNKNNIGVKYKGIHPSHLGKLDINVCGSKDPGIAGLLTPFCETDGLYFTNEMEPQDFIIDFQKDVIEFIKKEYPDAIIAFVEPDKDYFININKIKKDIKNCKYKIIKRQDGEKIITEVTCVSND